MLKMYVVDKQFGKPYITYRVVDTESGQTLKEGKCKEYENISIVFSGLVREHGKDNVKMLSR